MIKKRRSCRGHRERGYATAVKCGRGGPSREPTPNRDRHAQELPIVGIRPANPDYQPIVISANEGERIAVVAELVEVLYAKAIE